MKYISHDFGKKLFQSDTIYFIGIKIPDGGLEVVVTVDSILNYHSTRLYFAFTRISDKTR